MTSAALSDPLLRERDIEVAERHRYGDDTAFEEVFDRFHEMVYNLALRMTGDPEDAADLTQDAFLRIYRHLGSFSGRSTLKTWVYRVAINCCRSRLRRRSFRAARGPIVELDLAKVADERRGPEQRTLAGDARRRLLRGLAELPPIYREAVVLRDLEGLSYCEVAAALKLRIGTVRSRIARGRERLRKALEAAR